MYINVYFMWLIDVYTDDESSETNDEISDATINIRELDDVLMKDVGNKIAESGKYVDSISVVS